jgi:putative membrane protein
LRAQQWKSSSNLHIPVNCLSQDFPKLKVLPETTAGFSHPDKEEKTIMMMGFGGFGLLFMLFFFILVIGAAVALVSMLFPRPAPPASEHHPAARSSQPQPSADESALEILKQRYARGELTKSEYEAMKEDILAS